MGNRQLVLPSSSRQHHTDLSKNIMPLLAPSVPPGFEPIPNMVPPEVFDQMRLYMNCTNPEERRIREFKMKQTLDDLSKDLVTQRSCLRLEALPKITMSLNKDKGKVFDFSRVEVDQNIDVLNAVVTAAGNTFNNTPVMITCVSFDRNNGPNAELVTGDKKCILNEAFVLSYQKNKGNDNQEEVGSHVPITETPVFHMGLVEASSSGTSGRSRRSNQSSSSWSRKKRTNGTSNQTEIVGKTERLTM